MSGLCKKCGLCCRLIPVDVENQKLLRDGIQPLEKDFASQLLPVNYEQLQNDNEEYIKNVLKIYPQAEFYRCKYLVDDNLCTSLDKPEICKDLHLNNPKKQEEDMNTIISETDRLTILVNDILELKKPHPCAATRDSIPIDTYSLLSGPENRRHGHSGLSPQLPGCPRTESYESLVSTKQLCQRELRRCNKWYARGRPRYVVR